MVSAIYQISFRKILKGLATKVLKSINAENSDKEIVLS